MRTLVAALSSLFLLLGCGDSDETDPDASPAGQGYPRLTGDYEPTCAGYQRRLIDCGLITEGPFQCRDPEDSVEECFFGCLTEASCSLLAITECDGTGLPLAIERCAYRCESYACADGAAVPVSWVCDAEADCADGSDEIDCDYHVCDDGQHVVPDAACNFRGDCFDGSDEVGCPVFECASGEAIPEPWACDFDEDCSDGSDELGCPHIKCESDGEKLPASWRCDQEDDCLDGSDEFDCAQLLCR